MRKKLREIGYILRPRKEAVDLFAQAFRGGSKAMPPYSPFAPLQPAEAQRAQKRPARKRAAESRRGRRRRNSVKTGFLFAGQLPLRYLRCMIAGEGFAPPEVAGARKDLGCLRAALTDLSHLLERPRLSNYGGGVKIRRSSENRVASSGSSAWERTVGARGVCGSESKPARPMRSRTY